MIKKVLSRIAVLMIVAIVLGIIVAGYYKFVGVRLLAKKITHTIYKLKNS